MSVKNMDEILENRKNGLGRLVNGKYKNISEFCAKNDLDYSAVHRYLSGALSIGNTVVKKFERIFGLEAGSLDKPYFAFDYIKIPTYSSTGFFTSIDNLLNREPIANPSLEAIIFDSFEIPKEMAIGIQYDNNSMSPKIQSGWCVLVDRTQTQIKDGEIYAIIVENKIQFRRLFFTLGSNSLILKPLNTEFKEATVELNVCQIIGKAIYVLGGCI